jgi:hypothetical protein
MARILIANRCIFINFTFIHYYLYQLSTSTSTSIMFQFYFNFKAFLYVYFYFYSVLHLHLHLHLYLDDAVFIFINAIIYFVQYLTDGSIHHYIFLKAVLLIISTLDLIYDFNVKVNVYLLITFTFTFPFIIFPFKPTTKAVIKQITFFNFKDNFNFNLND